MENSEKIIQQGERLSFYKLFAEKKYKVCIPIIQRDYAQGRNTSKEVRNNFLTALYDYLEEEKPNRDLDFVYGTVAQNEGVDEFIPLDGQQRLTTLFLLHWYLSLISDDKQAIDAFNSALLKDGQSMFTYRTRSSSSEFCDALMSNGLDLSKLLPADIDEKSGKSLNNEISKTIRNSFWFYMSWRHDPTILSMLTMLDSIHHKFNGKTGFLSLLVNTSEPVITFLFLDLNIFKLTDDLYIKMNSRGKPLTAFENFKAKYEQSLENVDLGKRKFQLVFHGKGEDVSLKRYFSYNIDTKWANLLWNYRDLQNRDDSSTGDYTFDDELMNFIRVIFTNKYAAELNIVSKAKDDILEYLRGAESAKKANPDYSDIISYHKYKEFGLAFDKDDEDRLQKKPIGELFNLAESKERAYSYAIELIDALDIFSNGSQPIRKLISKDYEHYYNEEGVFRQALKHEFEKNQDRICFYAYLKFLLLHDGKADGIDEWMRVIYNLSHPENTIIDEGAELALALHSVVELLPYSNDILSYLKTSPKISSFSSWQVTEEIIKAHLILKGESWKTVIEAAEKHAYFNSQIGFLLVFSGIYDYFQQNKNCDWNEEENQAFLNSFISYSKKSSAVFDKDYDHRINDENYVFERAVFTKGDYLFPFESERKNLLSTSVVKNNVKRDHSWKRFLRISDNETWREKQNFVKAVLDDSRFDETRVQQSLEDIAKDSTGTWRDMFISCPQIFDFCQQGFIWFSDENDITLLSQSQFNHYHTDLILYYNYINLYSSDVFKYGRFHEFEFNAVKSIDDESDIRFEVYKHNRIQYDVIIYHCTTDDIPGAFELKFAKQSITRNEIENYPEDIKSIIEELGFQWYDDYAGFFYSSDKWDDLLSKLIELDESLPE